MSESEPRYTPGPWKAEEGEDWLAQYVYGGDGRPLCLVYTSEVHMHTARLIAVAPELLEALNECVNPLINALFAYLANRNEPEDVALFGLLDNTNMEVQAVIAKALGDAG